MNNIEYTFEGHDLTKEVVMVQCRDNTDVPWSDPERLGMVVKDCNYPYVTINETLVTVRYRYARLAKRSIKPWTLKTAPRHIEVELEKGLFYVAIIKDKGLVTFIKDGERYHLTWESLTKYRQWDGSPCGEVSE